MFPHQTVERIRPTKKMKRFFTIILVLVVPSVFADREENDFLEVPLPVFNGDTNIITATPYVAAAAPEPRTPLETPAPAVNFQGLLDNVTQFLPDTQGAVGPNHVMTMLNSQVRITDRTGTTTYLTTSLSNWWSSAASFISVFDPRITYDPYGERWIATVCADGAQRVSTAALLFGVSQGTDPTGSWYFQRVDSDANDLLWTDFPTVGFNKDWIAVSVNMYNSSRIFNHSRIHLFNRTNIYAGGTSVATIVNSSSLGGTIYPATTFSTVETNLYCMQTSTNAHVNAAGSTNGYVQLYKISGSIGSPTLSAIAYSYTAPWGRIPDSTNFAPQANTTVKIANNDTRMHGVVFRNGSIWATHNVFYPYNAPTYTAVQWWKLSASGNLENVGQIKDTTGEMFYAFPSIAVRGGFISPRKIF